MDFEITMEDFNEMDIGADIELSPTIPKKRKSELDQDIVSRARALYIAQNMSIPKIAASLGVSEYTLADYCKRERWTLYKTNPDLVEWSAEMFDDIYDNISFYDRAKEVLANMLEVEAFQSPKDVKAIIESFKVAEERTTSLRLIRENVGGLDGD